MLTSEELKERLHYDPETGVFTHHNRPGRAANKRAGTIYSNGYRVIHVSGRSYPAGRLAWLYMTGSWPTKMIDHKNRVRDDDRWENLREADRAQNRANYLPRRVTASGERGVIWLPDRRRWCVQIRKQGRYISRSLHIKLEDAVARARKIYAELDGEFWPHAA